MRSDEGGTYDLVINLDTRFADTQLEVWMNNTLIQPLAIPRDSSSSGQTDLPPVSLSIGPGLSVVRLKLLSGDTNLNTLTFTAEAQSTTIPKQVLAFYYPRYGNPQVSGQWVHWLNVDPEAMTIGNSTWYPQLGAYDSHDPDVIAQHFNWAASVGVTGFISSWWGQGTFEDQAMPMLLDAAAASGLHVTAYFEKVLPATNPTPQDAVNMLMYLLQSYAGHPAWLTVNGKPVVFVYGRAVNQLGLSGWREVIAELNQVYPGGALLIGDNLTTAGAAVFDGIHRYNITGLITGMTLDEIDTWANTTFPTYVPGPAARFRV